MTAELISGGLILIILAAIGVRTILRSRRNAARADLGSEPLMSSISPMAFQAPTLQVSSILRGPPNTSHLPAHQPEPSSPLISDGSHERSPALSSSESFHFPILSADGNLLPPVTNRGGHLVRSPNLPYQRPLPFAPTVAAEADLYGSPSGYSTPNHRDGAEYGLFQEDLAITYHRSFEAHGEDVSQHPRRI